MHIENINYMIECMSKLAKEYCDIDMESICTDELGKVVDMIKDLAEAEYYSRVSVAMENSKDKKFFHDPTKTTLDIYGDWPYEEDMYIGKAYYPAKHIDGQSGEFEKHLRMFRNNRSEHSENTAGNKQWRTQEIGEAIDALKIDMMDMFSDSLSDEKAIYKQKLTALVNSL